MSEINKIIENIAQKLSGTEYWLIALCLEIIFPKFRKIIVDLLNGFGKPFSNELISLDKIMLYVLMTYLLFIASKAIYEKLVHNDVTIITYRQWGNFLGALLNPCIMWGQLMINSIYISSFFSRVNDPFSSQPSFYFQASVVIITIFQVILAVSVSEAKLEY